MSQNINLLEELTVNPVSAYNCRLLARISIGWVLLLALIYAITLSLYSNQKKTFRALETTQKTLTTKIATYKQELAALDPAYINDLSPNSSSLLGFHRYLEDLAKFTPQGIWIKEMIFSEPDGAVTFKGSTIAASGISTFLNALGKSQSLNGKKFDTLHLQKDTESDGNDFIINTAPSHTGANIAGQPIELDEKS